MPSRNTLVAGGWIALMCLWAAAVLAYRRSFGEPAFLVGTLVAFVPIVAQRERGRPITPLVARLTWIWLAVLTVVVLTAPVPWAFRLRAIAAAIVLPVVAMVVLTGVSIGLGILVNLALNQETEPRYLRVPLLYYFGPVLLTGPLTLIAVAMTPPRAGVAGILGAIFLLMCAWLAAYRVEMTGTGIMYRTIRGTRMLAWANVEDAEVWRDRLGIQRLMLKPKTGSPVEPLQINLTVLEGSNALWLLKRARPWLLPKPRYRYATIDRMGRARPPSNADADH